MKILHRYLARELLSSTFLVLAALLMLFGFFDFIHELGDLGKGHYDLSKIVVYVLLSLPGHVYELFPIATLIGAVFALSQLVVHSELTVMRASGVSVRDLAASMLKTGVLFVLLTIVFGEFIAPVSERAAQQFKLKATSSVVAQDFRSGLWVKDATSFINIREMLPDTTLIGVKIYQFSSAYHLQSIRFADKGVYLADNEWRLLDVVETRFGKDKTEVVKIPQAKWLSVLTPDLLSVLLVVPEQMSAWNLYSYVQHLRENHQRTTRYAIAMWGKLVYPFATLVMLLLALPFSLRINRGGGVSAKIFTGIMVGLTFHLLNRIFAHLGLLKNWPPAFSAIFPSFAFLLLALGIIWWQERR
ncbi:MAG TPA: LPS export ABC transporter permease LptG [Betaproteobacteria bacterium]|nr:LPS export ABC transporter permease LptG [Betaproteobacteria bacterium]